MKKSLARMSPEEIASRLEDMEIEYCDHVAQGEYSPEEQAYAHKKLVATETALAFARKYYSGGN